MSLDLIKGLSSRDQALVAIAVLLDGREAEIYLKADITSGTALANCAKELASHAPEIRMPLAGTILRQAIEEMS